MSFRRRHRWTRRTLLGLAFAVMAAPASARPLEGASSELGLPPEETAQVIPYLSHGMGVSAADFAGQPQEIPQVIPYLSQGMGVSAADFAGQPQETAQATPYLSLDILGEAVKSQAAAPVIPDAVDRAVANHLRSVDPASVRPDDRVDRFVVGDGTPAPTTVADDGFALDWENGVTVGLGGLAIVFGIALALSYLRRPRIAV